MDTMIMKMILRLEDTLLLLFINKHDYHIFYLKRTKMKAIIKNGIFTKHFDVDDVMMFFILFPLRLRCHHSDAICFIRKISM